MRLRTCAKCGGPRRLIAETTCAKCRKHPKNECPDCGRPKLAHTKRCQVCHTKIANAARWAKHREPWSFTDECPQCGGQKRKVSRTCRSCFFAAQTHRRTCEQCGGEKSPDAALCHSCRYGRRRRHGWHISAEGRVMIYAGNHVYVPRARMVMAAVLGRPISDDEHVHHLNGIKDDDRPENLVVLTRAEHTALHHAQGDLRH